MYITHIFRNSGAPESGLSPTISIWEIETNQQVVTNALMTEIGTSGIYKYKFEIYSPQKEYVWKADGGSTLQAYFDTANAMSSERYPSGRLIRDNMYFTMRDLLRKFPEIKR